MTIFKNPKFNKKLSLVKHFLKLNAWHQYPSKKKRKFCETTTVKKWKFVGRKKTIPSSVFPSVLSTVGAMENLYGPHKLYTRKLFKNFYILKFLQINVIREPIYLQPFFKRYSNLNKYNHYIFTKINCPDFRYESNGTFVLGWVFFSSDKFRLFN